jgi:hypothetical protein
VVCDSRNNLIWNYEGEGTQIDFRATANIVNNYYFTTEETMTDFRTIRLGREGPPVEAFVSGNHSQNGFNLNDNGNRSTPFPIDPADVPSFTDARIAAQAVRTGAGARGPSFGLDATDQASIDSINLQ